MTRAIQRLATEQHRLHRRLRAQATYRTGFGDHQVLGGDVHAVQLRVAFEDVQRALAVAIVDIDLRIRVEVDRYVEGVGEYLHRRFLAIGAPGDHPQPGTIAALLGRVAAAWW